MFTNFSSNTSSVLCSVSCRGAVVNMPVLRAGDFYKLFHLCCLCELVRAQWDWQETCRWMLMVSKKQVVRPVGVTILTSWELGEMLSTVSCCGAVVSAPVLQEGDLRLESRWQQTFTILIVIQHLCHIPQSFMYQHRLLFSPHLLFGWVWHQKVWYSPWAVFTAHLERNARHPSR